MPELLAEKGEQPHCKAVLVGAGGNPCVSTGTRNTLNQYNRFGMLVRQELTGVNPEIMRYDGSGNMIYRQTYDDGFEYTRQDNFLVDSSASGTHNQLKRVTEAVSLLLPLNILYTPDGARKWEKGDPGNNDFRETYYYYDGLGRMAGSVERDDAVSSTLHHNPGSCIYDPEGQLAVPCAPGSVYLGFNGHNVSGALYTPSVTYPDAGWSFVHGPGTDDPLIGYHRMLGLERILYYVTDGQGRVLAVADSSGYRSPADDNTAVSRWRLAGGSINGNSFKADRMSGGDVPELSFYRNRAYDQTTGRWTQEDPIGVAGGLNLYQFNGNNPVTFSDPFGLCPPLPLCLAIGAVLAQRSANTPTGQRAIQAVSAFGGAVAAVAAAKATNLDEALTEVGTTAMGAISRGLGYAGIVLGGVISTILNDKALPPTTPAPTGSDGPQSVAKPSAPPPAARDSASKDN